MALVPRRASLLALLVALSASAGAWSCGGGEASPADARVEPPPSDEPEVEEARAPEPSGPPKRLFANRYAVRVYSQPNRDARRLGYLRVGATVMATTHDPIGNDGCRDGWFELATGGFVCSTRDVIPFEGRRLPTRRPAQPDLTTELPYRYARTRRDRLAVYRRLPTDEEAALYEGYRIPGQEPPEGAGAAEGEGPGASGASAEPAAGVARAEALVAATAGMSEAEATSGDAPEAAEDLVPTLASLDGERGGVLMRRMLKGFIVSIDRDARTGARRYWRTLANEFIPYFGLDRPRDEHFIESSTFHGAVLDRGGAGGAEREAALEPDARASLGTTGDFGRPVAGLALPIGFVMSSKVNQYTLGADGRPRRGRAPGYHHMFQVLDEAEHRGTRYVTTSDDRLFRVEDVRIIRAATERPSGVGEGDRWIDIDLAAQTLVAYEGLVPVFATLVSTGRVRDPDNPLRDMRTPTGLFRISSKHITHTMDGDHATDGPYAIQDVPYVMYFQLAYAIHSAFWHDSFGRTRSHGCVNLSPRDAKWLFFWAGPTLPEGWHAVFANEANPATWVYVHGETPQG